MLVTHVMILFLDTRNNDQSVGFWNKMESKQSSTFRELKAILYSLHKAFVAKLRIRKRTFFVITKMLFVSCMLEVL